MGQAVPTLHIVGCGRAAGVVARCLVAAGQVRVGQVINHSRDSAARAVEFIGQGMPASRLTGTSGDDWLLIGVPDSAIADVAASLQPGNGLPPRLAFHLSGSSAASALAALKCPVASVHPLRAFADPVLAAQAFPGTWCVLEGDAPALALLDPALQAAGARTIRLGGGDKQLYHAATVAASNFLVALNAFAVELAGHAGLEPAQAGKMLCDLQLGTLENIRALGAAGALTGPIERGDVVACRALLAAVPTEHQPLFRALGTATAELAARRHPEREWSEMRVLFKDSGS